MTSCIYNGTVIHKRFKPKVHYFKYNVFSLLIDLSELDQLDKKINLFSYNRFNLVSFYDKDHGDRNGTSLIEWVNKNLEKNKKAWCSWNSSINPNNKDNSSVTYWLNQLKVKILDI